jgi:hypothetical protein
VSGEGLLAGGDSVDPIRLKTSHVETHTRDKVKLAYKNLL